MVEPRDSEAPEERNPSGGGESSALLPAARSDEATPSTPPVSFWRPSEDQRFETAATRHDEVARRRRETLRKLDEQLERLRATPEPRPRPVSRYVLYFFLFTLLLSVREMRVLYDPGGPVFSIIRLHAMNLRWMLPDPMFELSPERIQESARIYSVPAEDLRQTHALLSRMAAESRRWRPGVLDWAFVIRLKGTRAALLFEYSIFLNLLYAAGLATVLFLRNRDLTSSRMVDRQREELKILNARQRVEMEETSNLLRDLHRAQAQLLAAEKLASLGRLSATLAHEIRNPLGIIASSVGMVAEDIDPASSAGQAIALVRDEIHRLNAIITDLLNFARPRPPNLQYQDLNDLLRGWITTLGEQFSQDNMQLLADFHPALPEVFVDADQLYQVVLNLLLNARDALEPNGGGDIIVSTLLESEDQAILSVRDTGTGIPPENISQVFEPFFTTKTSGTGLGLAVVRQLVEGMGGAVEIESQVGKGTTVRLRLPTDASALDAGARLTHAQRPDSSSKAAAAAPDAPASSESRR